MIHQETANYTNMIKSVFQILCFFAVVIALTDGTQVHSCSQGGIIPEEVDLDGCESNVDICEVPYSGIINITMKYKAPHYLESITTKLIGKTIFGEINLTVDEETDACTGILNTLCPLVPQELIEYKYSAQIITLPLLPLTLEFSIFDNELNETAICFDLEVYPVKS